MSDESKEIPNRPFADATGSGAIGLDHEIVNVGHEQWQVWTPDFPSGGCIGSGKSVRLAKESAIRNMEWLCDVLMGASKRPNEKADR
jgi:hypothetical protein